MLPQSEHRELNRARLFLRSFVSVSIVCSAVGSGADQRKHQSSVPLDFVRGIHR